MSQKPNFSQSVGKLFIMFQRVKKSDNTVSRAVISKTDILKFYYHDLSIKSLNDVISVFDMCRFHSEAFN
jgi:hypothetical protein